MCYTNSRLSSNVIPDDGHGERPKHVELLIEFLKQKPRYSCILLDIFIHIYNQVVNKGTSILLTCTHLSQNINRVTNTCFQSGIIDQTVCLSSTYISITKHYSLLIDVTGITFCHLTSVKQCQITTMVACILFNLFHTNPTSKHSIKL
jgi:hypothetical protein